MEFPHLGQHCSEATCNRLDFLPMKCDSCDRVFCSGHFNYEKHACLAANRKDVQVPICPMCGEPVPTPPGVAPDLTVGQHIDKQCKLDNRKIFTNACSYKGCKRKELIPVTCTQCCRNYCLRHRHTTDHECGNSNHVPGSSNSVGEDKKRALAANAAEYRRNNKPTTLFNTNPKPHLTNTTKVQNIQGNMTEDEALARALALSIMDLDAAAERNRRNEGTASAVAVGGQNSGKNKCSLS